MIPRPTEKLTAVTVLEVLERGARLRMEWEGHSEARPNYTEMYVDLATIAHAETMRALTDAGIQGVPGRWDYERGYYGDPDTITDTETDRTYGVREVADMLNATAFIPPASTPEAT